MFGRKQVGDADGTTGGKLVKTLLVQGDTWYDVMGTFAYEADVKTAKKRHRRGTAVGVLVPVNDGKYAGAVSVCINGTQLGSLPKEVAPDFYPLVRDLMAKKKRPTVLLDFADGDNSGFDGFIAGFHPELLIRVCADPTLAE